MSGIAHPLTALLLAGGALLAQYVSPGDKRALSVPRPAELTRASLLKISRPAVFFTPEEMASARSRVGTDRELAAYLAVKKGYAEPFASMDDASLRGFVPAAGEDIVYGLGMDLDPAGNKLRWAGWKDPSHVLGKDNVKYPNEEYPDDGRGGESAEFHFKACANGFTFTYLEGKLLPALAECYAFTGERKYAHAAAVLFDQLAPAYAASRRGPLDYPVGSRDKERGGRLNRPYYQTARGLMLYIHAFDLLLTSDELSAPSVTSPGRSICENAAIDIFWNGGIYCLGFTYDATALHNGHADYMRGAAAVGLLLGSPKLVAPLFSGDIGLFAMLKGNLDRDGFYYESSHGYSQHAVSLYQSMADLTEAAVRQGIPGAHSAYDSPTLLAVMSRYFDRAEVGGRLPLIGDDGPDRGVTVSDARTPAPGERSFDRNKLNQLNNAWLLLTRCRQPAEKRQAAEFLRNAYGSNPPVPPRQRSILFALGTEDMKLIESCPLRVDYFAASSILYASKGLALIRGGDGRHGLQLNFGKQFNHSQCEALSWTFFNQGAEWSYDPGYYNTHYRFGWTTPSVSHIQMTVDGQDADTTQGGGTILAWSDTDPFQFVMASNPAVFAAQGCTRHERLLAQADDDGKLLYWLDVGVLDGGSYRDDSFHTIMAKAAFNVPFEPTGDFSLGGDVVKGMKFTSDYRLDGFPDKPFYWAPPGNGYEFLQHPEAYSGAADVSAVFTDAAWAGHAALGQTIHVDFPGEVGRRHILVRSMPARYAPSVAYLLRRDSAPGVSVYAKVIYFEGKDVSAPVVGVRSLPLEEGSVPDSRAWCITLRDGRRDVWLLRGADARSATVTPAGLPRIVTTALVTVVRFDTKGAPVTASFGGVPATGVRREAGASVDVLSVGGRELLKGCTSFATKTAAIREGEGAPLSIILTEEAPEMDSCVMLTHGAGADLVNWSLNGVRGTEVKPMQLKTIIAPARLTPVAGREGVYCVVPHVARFISRGGRLSRFAAGKRLVHDGVCLGTILDAEYDDAKMLLKIAGTDGKPLRRAAFQADIVDLVPGDTCLILTTRSVKCK